MYHGSYTETLATPVEMAIGKEISNLFIFNDSPLTGVNTPGCDENSMKLICFDVHCVICCCKDLKFKVCHSQRCGYYASLLIEVRSQSSYSEVFKIYQNLELNPVKFKIRGGLLGIQLIKNSADGIC